MNNTIVTPASGGGAMTEPLRLTTARWHNDRRRDKWIKKLAHTGQLTQFAYGTDTPSEWNRRDLQACMIGTPQARVFFIDVDDEAEYMTTGLARYANREHAISERGDDRYHIAVDARMVPPQMWPKQGEIRGVNGLHAGDIKSNGWVPVPGSTHHSGEMYKPVLHQGKVRVLTCTPEILPAITAAQQEHTAGWITSGPGEAVPGKLPWTSATGGSDGNGGGTGGSHDDEVKSKVMGWIRQAANTGRDPRDQAVKKEIYEKWLEAATPRNPGDPFDPGDFERHYGTETRGALAKVLADPSPETPPGMIGALATWVREQNARFIEKQMAKERQLRDQWLKFMGGM